ncbi:MAG TPA: AMP-binding protein, partial [Accumulibacter sp.]|nr:AMP-binding protein [Accumulibacter sp.]
RHFASKEELLYKLIEDAEWTLPGILQQRCAHTPELPALWDCLPQENWGRTSWAEYTQAVARLATAFRRLGVQSGDRIGIMAPSGKHWDFAHLAILAAGGTVVGLDPHGLDEQMREIARRCEFTGLVLAQPAQMNKFDGSVRQKLRFVTCFDPDGDPQVLDFQQLLSEPSPAGADWNLAQPDLPATIIFTSGTTGEPKGIAYSHRQVCLAILAILAAFPDVEPASRLVCWLPLSQLFQRMINLSAIGRGAQTYYVADPRQVMQHIERIAPHLFVGVPRFYEKLYVGIQQAIGRQPAWRQSLVRQAWAIGDQHATALRESRTQDFLSRCLFALADRLVLRKLRGILGPELRFMISGSAPMPQWLLEQFHAIGLPIYEAYGISENIIPNALNHPLAFRFGTVGRVARGSELRLAEDGELLVRGPGVFSGYLGQQSPPSSLDSEGFLATGDFGSIDGDGFVTLSGRKAEIFKTSTGRRIAPAGIESVLQRIAGLEHVVIFGASRPQPVVLLVLNEDTWRNGVSDTFAAVRTAAAAAAQALPGYQRPAGLLLSARLLTIADGELTANLKLRRRNIEATHAPLLAHLYANLDSANGKPFHNWSDDQQYFFCSA